MTETDKIELRMWKLLTKYNKGIAGNSITSSASRFKEIEQNIDHPEYEIIEVGGMKEGFCFRIKFRYPLLILVSPEISRFKQILKYYKGDVGYMPGYLCSLNIFTVLKTWNEFAGSIQGPAANIPNGYTCLKLTAKKERPELSSLNFILRNSSDFEEANDPLHVGLMEKYFVYVCWSIKDRSFSENIQIFHDYYSIHSTHQFMKSLFVVDEIGESEDIFLDSCHLRLKKGRARRLVYGENGFRLESIKCYFTKDLVERISSENYSELVISGLLNRITIDTVVHTVLFDTIQIIRENTELVTAATGIAVTNRFDKTGSTRLGSRSMIMKEIFQIVSLFQDTSAFNGIQEHHISLFDAAMAEVSPTILDEKGEIYFVHPCLLSFLSAVNKFQDICCSDRLLLDLVKIVDYNRTAVRFSEEGQRLRQAGLNLQQLINAIPVLRDMITYSWIFRK
jgi:hypothetical protein